MKRQARKKTGRGVRDVRVTVRAAVSSRAKLKKKMKKHVSKEKGLTNAIIHRFCTLSCSSDFKGVYAADKIPRKLAGVGNFIIVVNLGEVTDIRGSLPVGHFVTIVTRPGHILYIDPYGTPCNQPRVLRFLELCGRRVVQNVKQIQDFTSNWCGMYAILFANYFDRKKPPMKMRFGSKNLKRNDYMCSVYLQKLFPP